MKKVHFSGSKWEKIVGYSRAQRVGNVIEVAGTTATDGAVIFGKDDVYAQTKNILERIIEAIEAVGGKKSDVVRTRMFITDMRRWQEAGKAHGEFFGDIYPASSMIEISALVDPEMLIEIEATAIVQE